MTMLFMFLLALAPIIWLVIALCFLKIPSHKACPISLAIAGILAVFVWKISGKQLVLATAEGSSTALWPICLVIVAAIFVYDMCVSTGKIDVIKSMLCSVSDDLRILILLIAWGFGGFMEGMAGFGTAVAIPASMLVSMGFSPLLSAMVCLICNATPTSFGSVGVAPSTIGNLLGIDIMDLSTAAAVNQIPLVILTPFVLVWIMGSFSKNRKAAFKGIVLVTFLSGLCFVVPELLVAIFIGPELASVVGAICSMGSVVLWCKITKHKAPEGFKLEGDFSTTVSTKEMLQAFSPFILTFVFLVSTSVLVEPVNSFLSQFKSQIEIYPGVTSNFSWINTPGVWLILSGIIGGKVQGASFKKIFTVFKSSAKAMVKTVISIVCIIATATIMSRSGMISDVAVFLADVAGNFYPLIAPLIGSIGTFVTGSATSSGVLFGSLQQQTANTLGINEIWLVSANILGGCAGKIISAQNITVAVVATGLIGKESRLLSAVFKYYLLYVAIMGLTIYFCEGIYVSLFL